MGVRIVVWLMIGLAASVFLFFGAFTGAPLGVIVGLLVILIVAALRVNTYSQHDPFDSSDT